MLDSFTRLTLEEELIFEGTIAVFKERIDTEKKGFITSWIDTNTVKCKAKFSLGTMRSTIFSNFFEGIKATASIKEYGSNTKVILKTKIRAEFYFFIGLFSLFIIASIIMNEVLEGFYYIFPGFLIWFFIVYRVQEIILFNSIRKFITKENKNTSPLITYNK